MPLSSDDSDSACYLSKMHVSNVHPENEKSKQYADKWTPKINTKLKMLFQSVKSFKGDEDENLILTNEDIYEDVDSVSDLETKLTPDFRLYRTYLQRYCEE